MGSSDEEGQILSRHEYWDARYQHSDGKKPTHEWFKSFAALKPFFASHLFHRSEDSRILHLGSGDSTIPYELAIQGFRNQVCVDFSPVVVKLMSSRAQSGIEWRQGDVRNLVTVPDRSIDVAFDKGTLDAMIYGSPWDPSDEVKDNTSKYIAEVCYKAGIIPLQYASTRIVREARCFSPSNDLCVEIRHLARIS